MDWQEISISVPYEYVEPVSYLFNRYGRGVSMEQDQPDLVLLRTYLPTTARQRFAHIDVGVRLISAIQPLGDLQVREVLEEDWQNSWKEHFGLLRVGDRIVIKPTWIEYTEAEGEIVVEIDPGMAFGTGYHPTTHTCLEAMEEIIAQGDQVLDLGTGSGILAIAAIKLGAERVVALDIDPQAIQSARQNLRRTKVIDKVNLALGTVPHPVAQAGAFDMAVANVSARGISERGQFIFPALRPGGLLVASGILQQQEEEVDQALVPLGFSLVKRWPMEDWVTLSYRRPE